MVIIAISENVETANSYNSIEEVNEFSKAVRDEERNSEWDIRYKEYSDEQDADAKKIIADRLAPVFIGATLALERKTFKGFKKNDEQSLKFPMIEYELFEGESLEKEVPAESIRYAHALLVIDILKGKCGDSGYKKQKIGEVSFEKYKSDFAKDVQILITPYLQNTFQIG